MKEEDRRSLLTLLKQHSFFEGDFVLTSGRKSDVLVDVKRTALHPEGNRLIGEAMLSMVRSCWPEASGIGGRTLGADPLAVAISRSSLEDGGDHLQAFIVRKETKGHGSSKLMECSGALASGARVVVLEDTTTTGGSAVQAAQAVDAEGFHLCGILTLVDRQEGASERFEKEGMIFRSVFTMSEIRAHAL